MRDLWGVTRNCVGEVSAIGVRLLCTDPSELQLPNTSADSILLLLVRAGHLPHRKCMSFFWGGGGGREPFLYQLFLQSLQLTIINTPKWQV